MLWKKAVPLAVACVMGLSLFGCAQKVMQELPAPSRVDKPLLEITTGPAEQVEDYTPVYAVAYGDTIYLSKMPIMDMDGEEPECDIREVSLGGRIHCGQEHESKEVVTRVVITEEICPESTADWFRDMTTLVSIEGLEKLRMDGVTDMSFMFSGCVRLNELAVDDWNVSNVTDMTGIFDGCDALADKPAWYEEATGGLGDLLEEEDTFDGGAIH